MLQQSLLYSISLLSTAVCTTIEQDVAQSDAESSTGVLVDGGHSLAVHQMAHVNKRQNLIKSCQRI